MHVQQISVFIENKHNSLLSVTRCLAEHQINVLALSAADSSDTCILRLIVNRPDLAYQVLRAAHFTVMQTDVLAFAAEDRPGGLNLGLEVLSENNITVEYIYAFFSTSAGAALNIVKVDQIDAGEAALRNAGVRLLEPKDVYCC